MKTKKPKIETKEASYSSEVYHDLAASYAVNDRIKIELSASYEANTVIANKLTDLEQKIHEGNIWNKENPRWTPRVQEALAFAQLEAETSDAKFVGTEHILLGMLRQDEGIASHHFRAIGMSYEKVCYALKVSRFS